MLTSALSRLQLKGIDTPRKLFVLLIVGSQLIFVNSLAEISLLTTFKILSGLTLQCSLGHLLLLKTRLSDRSTFFEMAAASFLVGALGFALFGMLPRSSLVLLLISGLSFCFFLVQSTTKSARRTKVPSNQEFSELVQICLIFVIVLNFILFRYDHNWLQAAVLLAPLAIIFFQPNVKPIGLAIYALVSLLYSFLSELTSPLSPTIRNYPITRDDIVEIAVGQSILTHNNLNDFMQYGEKFSYHFLAPLYKSTFNDSYNIGVLDFDPLYVAALVIVVVVLLVGVQNRFQVSRRNIPEALWIGVFVGVWPLWTSSGIGAGSDSQLLAVSFVSLFLLVATELNSWAQSLLTAIIIGSVFVTKAPLTAFPFIFLVTLLVFRSGLLSRKSPSGIKNKLLLVKFEAISLGLSGLLSLCLFGTIFLGSTSMYSERQIGLSLPRGYWGWPDITNFRFYPLLTILGIAFAPTLTSIVLSVRWRSALFDKKILCDLQKALVCSVQMFLLVGLFFKSQSNFNFYFVGLNGLLLSLTFVNYVDYSQLKRTDWLFFAATSCMFSYLFLKLNFWSNSENFHLSLLYWIIGVILLSFVVFVFLRRHKARIALVLTTLSLCVGSGLGDSWSPVRWSGYDLPTTGEFQILFKYAQHLVSQRDLLDRDAVIAIDPQISNVDVLGALISGLTGARFLCLPISFLQYPTSSDCLRFQSQLVASSRGPLIDEAYERGITLLVLDRNTFNSSWVSNIHRSTRAKIPDVVFLDDSLAIISLKNR